MRYRHEYKHEITHSDMLILRQRLNAVARRDSHAIGGEYLISSLYFDDPFDSALREKLNGVDRREKFRIRYYNSDTGFMRLEKKCKTDGLCLKESCPITAGQTERILTGDTGWMMDTGVPLIQDLYSKMNTQCLAPKTIVEYTREPFVYSPGNTRVTIDRDIKTSLNCKDFLAPDRTMLDVSPSPIILEVKWDEFLPAVIRGAVQLDSRRSASYSKYAASRVYG